jgi:hypothetical protein
MSFDPAGANRAQAIGVANFERDGACGNSLLPTTTG